MITEKIDWKKESREIAERQAELKENKEAGENKEQIKEAAARERAEYLVKEVKSNRKQMQNIFLHMQQVLVAINQLRVQLQIVQKDDDPESVKQDKNRIEKLKVKIGEYKEELLKMKDDLINEYMEEVRQKGQGSLKIEEIKNKAEKMVEELLAQIE